jgi:flagellar biosynthesis protein FlhG
MTEKTIRTMSVTSGKGGVGKTTIIVNLAHCLANLNKKVLILDGDMSLANVDIFLKKTAEGSVKDFYPEKFHFQMSLLNILKTFIFFLGGAVFLS